MLQVWENASYQDSAQHEERDACCQVLSHSLSSLHCYLLHSDDQLYRLSDNSSKFESRFSTQILDEDSKDKGGHDDGESAPLSIDFGKSPLRWLPLGVASEFNSFRDEIVYNAASTIDEYRFDMYKLECLAKIKGTNYRLNEMMSLKLYADTTTYQSLLRRAFWTTTPLKTKRRFYRWAIAMYRAHLYHAVPIPSMNQTIPCEIFHGLTQLFRLDQEMPVYHGPFSTTISKDVANTFTKGECLLFTIQSSYANSLKRSVGIDMQSISSFKHEKEVLLFNQFIPIKKTRTFEHDAAVLINHLMYSLKSKAEPITDKRDFLRKVGVQFNDDWIPQILAHETLFQVTEYSNKCVEERLWQELGIDGVFAAFMNRTILRHQQFIIKDGFVSLNNTERPCTNKCQHLKYLFGVSCGETNALLPRHSQYSCENISSLRIPLDLLLHPMRGC